MDRRPLGNTGLTLPVLSFGASSLMTFSVRGKPHPSASPLQQVGEGSCATFWLHLAEASGEERRDALAGVHPLDGLADEGRDAERADARRRRLGARRDGVGDDVAA